MGLADGKSRYDSCHVEVDKDQLVRRAVPATMADEGPRERIEVACRGMVWWGPGHGVPLWTGMGLHGGDHGPS